MYIYVYVYIYLINIYIYIYIIYIYIYVLYYIVLQTPKIQVEKFLLFLVSLWYLLVFLLTKATKHSFIKSRRGASQRLFSPVLFSILLFFINVLEKLKLKVIPS